MHESNPTLFFQETQLVDSNLICYSKQPKQIFENIGWFNKKKGEDE